jgi:hypothetical protein
MGTIRICDEKKFGKRLQKVRRQKSGGGSQKAEGRSDPHHAALMASQGFDFTSAF